MPRIYKRDLIALVLALIGIIALIVIILLNGCAMAPLKPGRSAVASPGLRAELAQSDNPAQASEQETEEWIEPGGAALRAADDQDGAQRRPTVLKRRTVTRIGAAQKDTAREIGAKLASLRGVQWLGALVFLFGAASFAWPPLKAIVGSVTTSGVITLAGLALIFLPTMLVGHELIILGVCAALAGAWMLAHRHGRLRGFMDANKDGIDDRTQGGAQRRPPGTEEQ